MERVSGSTKSKDLGSCSLNPRELLIEGPLIYLSGSHPGRYEFIEGDRKHLMGYAGDRKPGTCVCYLCQQLPRDPRLTHHIPIL